MELSQVPSCQGPNIQDQTDLETIESDIALTISQLLLFNTVKHRSVAGSACHNTERETPLAIYLGLLIHAQTRSKEFIDKLHKLVCQYLMTESCPSLLPWQTAYA